MITTLFKDGGAHAELANRSRNQTGRVKDEEYSAPHPLIQLWREMLCWLTGGHEHIWCHEGDGTAYLCCIRCFHRSDKCF